MQTTPKDLLIRYLKFFLPPSKWKIPVIVLLGILTGLGFHIFYISNAISYFSDKPETCINCHVMNTQYVSWEKGSHGRVASCNDCHVPQNNFISKYYFKAKDGLRHATIFTLRTEPQVIQIKQDGKNAVQSNCIRCHYNLLYPISTRAINNKSIMANYNGYCWDCHRETPHGRVTSLSSASYARVPYLKPIMPKWLEKIIEVNNKNN
jgi:cytochrome c nitrite reductase small subunit